MGSAELPEPALPALALPLGVAYVTILAVGLSAGTGLAVILVGLVLLLATLFAVRAMAALERTLARNLLRITIHPPIEGGIDITWRQRIQLWLRDPVTWKSLVYLRSKLPMGIVSFTALVVPRRRLAADPPAPVLVLFTPVIFFGWEIDDPLTGAARRAARPVPACCSACTSSTAWRGCSACSPASCSARAPSTCASASRACATPARAS